MGQKMNGSISPQLSPRRVHGFGATDPFASAKQLLTSSMSSPIAFGDTLILAGNYAAAIAQYQAAGNAGAAVGNAVKAAGGNTAVFSVETIADNATLQSIPTSAPNSFVGESNAASAQGLVKGMVRLYQQAMTSSVTATGPVKAPAPAPAPSASSKTMYYVVGGVAVAALGTGAWYLYGRKKR
jgi:hypothetical protein